MRARRIALVAVSLLFAVACVRLGFWQVGRLHEKQKYNETVASRRFLPAIAFESLPTDTLSAKLRRVRINGRYDYNNEIVWILRGRDGSPGVNIITPILRAGNDTAVLVNRGWVYSPDAMTVDLSLWRESDTLFGEGYVLPLRDSATTTGSKQGSTAFRSLDLRALRKVFPYPIAAFFAVLTTPAKDSLHTPPRVTLLPLDEGSHRSYAFQWFSFAAISIIGAGIFIRKT